jgi:BON domain
VKSLLIGKIMTSFGGLTKLMGLVPIALLVLTSCNQPPTSSNSQPDTTRVVTTEPANSPTTNNPNSASVISIEDAAENVENALDNHPTLRAFDLDANDEGNAIVLTGRVQTDSQKQLAQALTQQVAPGVAIVNQIVF